MLSYWGSVILLLFPTLVFGITGNPVREETITVSSSAIGITGTVCGDAAPGRALVQVKDNQIYYLFNAGAGTPDSGDYLGYVGDVIEVEYPGKFRMIRVGSDAKVKVTCFQ